jgi:hypothetical protein
MAMAAVCMSEKILPRGVDWWRFAADSSRESHRGSARHEQQQISARLESSNEYMGK